MSKKMGPQPNTNYLKSAIGQMYGDDEDFIVLGLTGRTGSGCSTAAKILLSSAGEIRHSLFSGENPASNEQRKERILLRHFKATWEPFLLIQVRSIITTFLLDTDISLATNFFDLMLSTQGKRDDFTQLLEDLRQPYLAIRNDEEGADATYYYTQTLPKKCEALREVLGESDFVQLYQTIGKNLRLSGDPYKANLEEGRFFTLAQRINEVINLIYQERKKSKSTPSLLLMPLETHWRPCTFRIDIHLFFLSPYLHRNRIVKRDSENLSTLSWTLNL